MYKKVALLVAVFISATAFWFFAKQWIHDPGLDWGQMNHWLWPLLLLALLASVKATAYWLLEGRWRWGTMAVAAVPFILLFGIANIYLIAALVMIGLNALAIQRIRDETNARLTINPRATLRRGIPLIITSLLLAGSFAYFQSPSVQESVKTKALPPFIAETVRGTARQMLDNELSQLSPNQRVAAENQIVTETVGRINNLVAPYRQYMPPVLAFGLFIILQGLSFIFVWLSAQMGWLLFWILKKADFVAISKKSVEAETVSL